RALPNQAGGTMPIVPQLPVEAPRVVIIDSGIAAKHPLFTGESGQTIIGRQMNFLPESVEAADLTEDDADPGHGTAIASIAAYGSLTPLSLNQPLPIEPNFWLENAKAFFPAAKLTPDYPDDPPQFHPTQFPKTLMREIVAEFHRSMPQQCKIFNLSLNTVPHPQQAMSNWAEELDNLSAQNDLMFVVSAGDLSPEDIVDFILEEHGYPEYLLDPYARLRDPGQAYSALTVGAIAGQPIAPLPPWKDAHVIAPAEYPAPFTRNGVPQAGGIVKPDVVEVGGNLLRGSELGSAPELAVLAANRNFATGQSDQPLGFHYGAGVATAKVTNLAGRIQAQHPEATANLIRALVVNSADWPSAFVNNLTPNPDKPTPKDARETMLRLCGYGVPQADKALSANTHCMVFVAEDKFSWVAEDRNTSGRYPAKVSFFTIRLEPDDLFQLPPATRVRVSITLTYNPEVRKTQRRRYQAVNMRWELKRQNEATDDFYTRWMREVEGKEDEETPEELEGVRPKPWPWQLKPVLNPGGRVRRGSVIRDWFDTYVHDLPHTLEIVTLAMVAPWRKPPNPLTQPFALVVSIEALDQAIPIYDNVRVQEDEGDASSS
ncbi:MAG: S8 family peptidase, partial [Chloroflexota bacterium]